MHVVLRRRDTLHELPFADAFAEAPPAADRAPRAAPAPTRVGTRPPAAQLSPLFAQNEFVGRVRTEGMQLMAAQAGVASAAIGAAAAYMLGWPILLTAGVSGISSCIATYRMMLNDARAIIGRRDPRNAPGGAAW